MSRVRLVSALIGLAAAARAIALTCLRPLNWDEIEFFRATRWVAGGLVPYRDFFEHHTPLQWFVFAPVAMPIDSPGTIAIIAMRWAQVPVWIATLWLMSMWMRAIGIPLLARIAAVALAVSSSMFMLAATEYRVDALGCLLLVLALVLAERGAPSWSGAALVLAGMANIRLGPVLVVALIAFAVRRRDRVLRLAAGVAAALAVCASYFAATGSVAIAWQRLIRDNYAADHLAARTPGIFLHRLGTPFGVTFSGFVASAVDPATIIIFIAGAVGIVIAFIRRDRRLLPLAIIQIANIAFIALMKFVQTYHFETVIVLMLPFAALQIERCRREQIVTAVLAVVVLFSVAATIFRGKEADLQYQDAIMRAADRLTPPSGTVFDGAGWVLLRRPAYRYWFLREIVRVLEAHGQYEPFRVDPANPPAAFISDYGARLWLSTHPDLRRYFMSHYVPYWRDLWLPAMSGVIAPGARATWIVPAGGRYAIYASPALAAHPWFRGSVLSYTRLANGKPVTLRRGVPFTMVSNERQPVGVFILPAGMTGVFRQPPNGADIDAAPPPRWHVPHLW